MSSIRHANTESTNEIFEVVRGEERVQITLKAAAARIQGRVVSEDRTVAALAQVVLMRERANAPGEFDAKPAVFDQTGAFRLDGIAPGDYRLFAFESVPEHMWLDPAFFEAMKSRALDVKTEESEAKTIRATVIPKSVTAEVLRKLGVE